MGRYRYERLDFIRGTALLNMIAYHLIWDLVYIYRLDWGWYRSAGAYAWQQGICWTFIFLSGLCLPLGRHAIKRGLIVSACGIAITVVTLFAMPQNRVVFGVLTLIGCCMLIVGLSDSRLRKVPPLAGAVGSAVLFGLTRNVNQGCLGFERFEILALPDGWYRDLVTAFLGFPSAGFYSTDYFSLFPWMFLFLAGYFTFLSLDGRQKTGIFRGSLFFPVEWLGRHSLWIYMLHQPLIYLILQAVFSLAGDQSGM